MTLLPAGRRPRPATNPEALRRAAAFPALEAIFTRRSRRFALGAELTGPLAYRSEAEPVPLSTAAEAILVAAATGVTGVARDEWPFLDEDGGRTGADKLTSYTGRTYPSPLATHGTELFWTNDDGVFVLPQRDAEPEHYVQLGRARERDELHAAAVKLQDGRLDVPRATPNLFGLNHWIAHHEGSTLFLPVSDVTRQCISALLLYFDEPHRYYLHDPHLGGDPLRPLVRDGWFSDEHPVDLWDFERWQMVDMNGVEQGLMVQSLLIATQALGLGGHPFSGGKGRVTMGGEELWHAAGGSGSAGSLGFTFHEVPADAPYGPGSASRSACPASSRASCRRSTATWMRRWTPSSGCAGARTGSSRRRTARPSRGASATSSPACHGRRSKRWRRRSSSAATCGRPTGASRRRSTRSSRRCGSRPTTSTSGSTTATTRARRYVRRHMEEWHA